MYATVDSNEVAAIFYTTIDSESTRLRCCLAGVEDFKENDEACEYQTEEVKDYLLNGDVCEVTICDRTDTYLPNDGSSRALIFHKFGESCTNERTELLGKEDCCRGAGQGCGRIEHTPPEYTGGSCLNDECSECSLTSYMATNYFNDDDALINRIVDYDSGVTEDSVSDKAVCCAAGI